MATASKSEDATAVPEIKHTHVKYTGIAHIRSISAAEWNKAKVENQKATQWDADNDFVLPMADFNAAALKYCVERDGEMKLVTVKE